MKAFVFNSFVLGSMALLFAAVCQGQSCFTFNNHDGPRTPIFGPDVNDSQLQQWGNPPDANPPGVQVYTGPLLAGTNYSVEATYSLQPVADVYALMPNATQVDGSLRTFSSFFPGYFFGGERCIAAATNFEVYLQVRAWDNAGGLYPTWDAAWSAAQAGSGRAVGWSMAFYQPLVQSDVVPYPYMENFESFNTFILPEPRTVWLVALAGAFWLIGRRRSN